VYDQCDTDELADLCAVMVEGHYCDEACQSRLDCELACDVRASCDQYQCCLDVCDGQEC